jgi:hypothetical protein
MLAKWQNEDLDFSHAARCASDEVVLFNAFQLFQVSVCVKCIALF